MIIDIPGVIIGCGTFGGIGKTPELIGKGLDKDAAFATLDEAMAMGLTMLDTAERYAAGTSETIIGAWLRNRPDLDHRRLEIATKVAPAAADGIPDTPFDRAYIERKLCESLARLGVARISWYLSHEPDATTPIEATLEGFAAVVESGKVRHLGCCNVERQQLTRALDAAERLDLPRFECVQNGYSLLLPGADRDVRALCRERGLAYTAFSPLAGGVLSGKYRHGEPYPAGSRMALRPEGYDRILTGEAFAALERLREFAAAREVSCAALALAWLIAHPDCAAPVAGPARTSPHLGHVREALQIRLTAEEHTLLGSWFGNAGGVQTA